jgi:hypothetical protein
MSGGAARAVALLYDGAAFRAHPVGLAGRVASVFVLRVAVGTLERRPSLPWRPSADSTHSRSCQGG